MVKKSNNKWLVPGAGIEPARYFYRGILSPLRLPISPPGHVKSAGTLTGNREYKTEAGESQAEQVKYSQPWVMEAGVGIEPAYTELQSAA